VKTSKREPFVFKFLRTGIVRTGLIFQKQMLIPLLGIEILGFFWGGRIGAFCKLLCENQTQWVS
jgi:hypothetical protein